MARDDSVTLYLKGCAVGGAVGGAVGAVSGTYDAIRSKVPGLLKVRYIGLTTVHSAAVGFFLGSSVMYHNFFVASRSKDK